MVAGDLGQRQLVLRERRDVLGRLFLARGTESAPWLRGQSPVNIEACEGSVQGATAVESSKTIAIFARSSRVGVVFLA